MQDIKGITAQLQAWINQMQSAGKVVDIDALNHHLAEMMTVQNSTPIDRFNGFTSEQMHQMIYFPLETVLSI